MNKSIKEKLISIIIQSKDINVSFLADETDLINDLCLSSSLILNIVMEIEKRFDILLVDDKKTFESFKKFSNLVKLVEEEVCH